jgi:hypothetical protein
MIEVFSEGVRVFNIFLLLLVLLQTFSNVVLGPFTTMVVFLRLLGE